VVLIFISSITDVEHFFSVLTTCVTSLEKCIVFCLFLSFVCGAGD
jgi:hypothetical protein